MTSLLCIDRRFNGPPDSGNGGYSCGLIAVAIGKPVKVRLVQPVPREIRVRAAAGPAVLH